MENGTQKRQPAARVTLMEVGLRDGFQMEEKPVPTALKIELVSALVDAGLRRIQAASFVHPQKVPQMADAEELFRGLPKISGVRYSALVLNPRGLARALAAGVEELEISVSTSDAHSRRNAGMGAEKALGQGLAMIREAKTARIVVRGGIQCAFGCVTEGRIAQKRVLAMAEAFLAGGVDQLVLCDTAGMAGPVQVRRMLDRVMPAAGSIPLAVHLHDTRGLGLVNAAAALDSGVTHFDTAAGGMGGCPFVAGAAGNIATEDTAVLMAKMGVETGIDIAKVAGVTERLEAFFGKRFPARNRKETFQPEVKKIRSTKSEIRNGSTGSPP
ncbi:MAG: hydroxymethylglutaryl-CoA lyase [Desulfobacterales bacterium]|nr:hydroxymethylglutaryl-CoA lyase [Desulfobacterales bacterium]